MLSVLRGRFWIAVQCGSLCVQWHRTHPTALSARFPHQQVPQRLGFKGRQGHRRSDPALLHLSLAPCFQNASQKIKVASKIAAGYAAVKDGAPSAVTAAATAARNNGHNPAAGSANGGANGTTSTAPPAAEKPRDTEVTRIIQRIDEEKMDKARQQQEANRKRGQGGAAGGGSLVLFNPSSGSVGGGEGKGAANQLVVSRRAAPSAPRPDWHAPWKLSSVVSAHLGWVRAIAFDPSNEWFVTGSADRTIKVWDLAKASAGADKALKLTLTGHINCIRGLAVSPRHPYLFSAAEDKKVMCWDLEYNRVVRHYHGHLSGVHCLSLHPTLDVLVTGGRDSVARVWDMRTKKQIHALGGHSNAVGAVQTNAVEPQVRGARERDERGQARGAVDASSAVGETAAVLFVVVAAGGACKAVE